MLRVVHCMGMSNYETIVVRNTTGQCQFQVFIWARSSNPLLVWFSVEEWRLTDSFGHVTGA